MNRIVNLGGNLFAFTHSNLFPPHGEKVKILSYGNTAEGESREKNGKIKICALKINFITIDEIIKM